MNFETGSNTRYDLGIIGVLPPPVTGMTSVTGFLNQYFSNSFNVRVYNFLPNGKRPKYFWPLVKLLKTMVSCLKIIIWKYKDNVKIIYYPCNSNCSILLDIFIGIIIRIFNLRVMIHHHAYSYIFKKNRLMTIFTKLLKEKAMHIFLCSKMQTKYHDYYQNAKKSLVIKNGFMIEQISKKPKSLKKNNIKPFTIGHISNLDTRKGLDLVLKTFDEIKKDGMNVTLILAGPIRSKKESKILNHYKKKYPNTLNYLGAIYGVKKDKFYNEIDLFLFPTKYLNETYPLVILESFSFGVPVISYDRGCISDLIDGHCGFLIDVKENFVSSAIKYIYFFIQSKNIYFEYSLEALKLATLLRKRSRKQLFKLESIIREKQFS